MIVKLSSLTLLLFSCISLIGCSSLTAKIPLSDVPSPVELSYGKSVKRMIKIQKRPRVEGDTLAGYELLGWEAEKILTDFDKPK